MPLKSRTYTVILTVVMTAFLLVWAEPSRSKEVLEKIERVLLVDCPFPPSKGFCWWIVLFLRS